MRTLKTRPQVRTRKTRPQVRTRKTRPQVRTPKTRSAKLQEGEGADVLAAGPHAARTWGFTPNPGDTPRRALVWTRMALVWIRMTTPTGPACCQSPLGRGRLSKQVLAYRAARPVTPDAQLLVTPYSGRY